jgi:pimeloyl-ACP methyl ester carboxylesterase
MTIVLRLIVCLLCGLDPPSEAGPVASQPTDHRAVIRAAFDRINITPSYFPEMDALKDEITPADLPLLHAELSHGHGRSRRAAAWILAHISSPESVDPLRKALVDDTYDVVRWEAAHTLGYIGAQAAEADLIHTLQSDPSKDVRARAAEALNMLGTPGGLAAIRKAADVEQDASVKQTLKFLLGDIRYRQHRRAAQRPGEVTEGYFKGTRYLIYTPRGTLPRKNRRWLVSVHGTQGNPEHLIDLVKADADRHHLMVLAPHFDYGQYSWFGMFNLRRGKVRPDLRMLEIIDDVSRGAATEPRLLLFGHSEGGQFVHRFVLAHPDRVERAVAASAGMLVRPDPATPFPTGTAANPLAPDLGQLDFSKLVQTPLALVCGTKEEAVRRSRIDAFMEGVRQYAKEKGITSKVRFLPVPEGGHSSTTNWRVAREFLFPADTDADQRVK